MNKCINSISTNWVNIFQRPSFIIVPEFKFYRSNMCLFMFLHHVLDMKPKTFYTDSGQVSPNFRTMHLFGVETTVDIAWSFTPRRFCSLHMASGEVFLKSRRGRYFPRPRFISQTDETTGEHRVRVTCERSFHPWVGQSVRLSLQCSLSGDFQGPIDTRDQHCGPDLS